MDGVIIVIFIGGLVIALVVVPRILQNYWEQESNLSDEDHEFDRRVAEYNNELAYRKRDDEIVNILRGRNVPTLAERYGLNDEKKDDR